MWRAWCVEPTVSRGRGWPPKVTVALKGDPDCGPADETVRFEFGGADYEMHERCAFRHQFAPIIEYVNKCRARPGARAEP